MDHAGHALVAANLLYARATNGTTTVTEKPSRPPVFKAVGIALAISSGVFIGISFVLKKVGLLKANEKYEEVAGEGYGYLKNVYWWGGMILMIIGEVCNFAAYMFVDAILVTPLGALSVVVTTILSAIFLKERLSLVGKVGCFLCIVGSVIIAMNGPAESAAATIQDMQHFVIAPGFLSYAGVIIVGCIFIALWAGPRYGKKSMLVYLSICSLIGGLSVVATQGLGAAIVTQIGGKPQFNQWFTYVLLVFVIATLVTEIIYLNKALNIFNAALVTPTYYVFFTSSTIITSVILFRGFKGTVTSILTVVMGFLVICAGVVILQLSKSAKDVPDAAVFSGDLDQVRTIAEQEQPESEPKADAIRGTAAIVRRFSQARQKMEMEEAKRLHDEKQLDLEPIGENERVEWDGLRRRRTTYGSRTGPPRSAGESSTPFPQFEPIHTPTQHPPLGMSRFPDETDSDNDEERPRTGGMGSSFFGSIRDRARSVIVPGSSRRNTTVGGNQAVQSPMHPVPLTEISIPTYKGADSQGTPYYGHQHDLPEHTFGLPANLKDQKTEYEGAGSMSSERHIRIVDDDRTGSRGSLHPDTAVGPTPPPHSARRQFSFQNVFRKAQSHASPSPMHDNESSSSGIGQSRSPIVRKTLGQRKLSHTQAGKGATEEERLGLVKGDTITGRTANQDDGDEEEDDDYNQLRSQQPQRQQPYSDEDRVVRSDRRDLTPPRAHAQRSTTSVDESQSSDTSPDQPRRPRKLTKTQKTDSPKRGNTPPKPPPHDEGTLGRGGGRTGGGSSFI